MKVIKDEHVLYTRPRCFEALSVRGIRIMNVDVSLVLCTQREEFVREVLKSRAKILFRALKLGEVFADRNLGDFLLEEIDFVHH